MVARSSCQPSGSAGSATSTSRTPPRSSRTSPSTATGVVVPSSRSTSRRAPSPARSGTVAGPPARTTSDGGSRRRQGAASSSLRAAARSAGRAAGTPRAASAATTADSLDRDGPPGPVLVRRGDAVRGGEEGELGVQGAAAGLAHPTGLPLSAGLTRPGRRVVAQPGVRHEVVPRAAPPLRAAQDALAGEAGAGERALLDHVVDVGGRLDAVDGEAGEQVLGQHPLGAGAVARPPAVRPQRDADAQRRRALVGPVRAPRASRPCRAARRRRP